MKTQTLGATALTAAAKPAPSFEVVAYAVASLRAALQAVATAYQARHHGVLLRCAFGASAGLRDGLLGGEHADVFASANLTHLAAIARAGRAAPPRRFARDALCALARPGLGVDGRTLIAHLLDPGVKLGTSIAEAEPCGDDAWLLFQRIERSGHPGACARLAGRAQQLAGGPGSPAPPAGRNAHAALLASGRADILITHGADAAAALREEPSLVKVALPPALEVSASYGLAVLEPACDAARSFAAFLLGVEAQRILGEHGFATP